MTTTTDQLRAAETAHSPLVARECPVCGASGRPSLFAEANFRLEELDQFAFASRKMPEYMHARLEECGACDVLYANPALDPGALAGFYRDADFDSGLESEYAARTYERVLRPLFTSLPKPLSSLDIGCGDGTLLEQLAQAGFSEVNGVEPSLVPIQSAKAAIRERIRCGLFDAKDYKPASFSLVTCFMVMEHVPDPLELCRGVLSLLRPGGAFAVIVHDRRALSAKILGRKSPIFDIEHLQLFSKTSGARLMTRAGFTDVRVSRFWNRYPLQYWLRLFPFPKAMKLSLINLSRQTGAGDIPLSIPAGNLILTGRKP